MLASMAPGAGAGVDTAINHASNTRGVTITP